MRMLKFSKIAVLFVIVFSLLLTACSGDYPNRPNDVRKDVWEQVNETYIILDENWKSIDLPSEYDMEVFFSFHDEHMGDVNELSENEYNLINGITKMIYYLSEYQGMFFSTNEDYTDDEKREMLAMYNSHNRKVADILGIEME